MNTKALLATLVVIGSSTAALADPIGVSANVQANTNVNAGLVVRDHRDVDTRRDVDGQWMRDHRRLPEWTVLSARDSLRYGRDTIRPSQAPMFTQLKLQATSGKLEIDRVVIRFGNGSTQTVTPHAMLQNGSPSLTIDLNGDQRHIAAISVFGKGGRRASYQILAA